MLRALQGARHVLRPALRLAVSDSCTRPKHGHASPLVSLGAHVTQGKELLYEAGIAFAALGFSKLEELPHREIARMRCHKVEETGLYFCVAEGAKWGEVGFLNAHRSQAVDRRRQFPLVAEAALSS